MSEYVNLNICSDSEYDVTDLTLLLIPFAWLPVLGTILLIIFHLVNSKFKYLTIYSNYICSYIIAFCSLATKFQGKVSFKKRGGQYTDMV